MFKYLFWILFLSSLYGQQISYDPQFSNINNSFDWERGLISSGIVTLSVISIYNAGKPIYYNQAQGDFHFTKDNKGRLEFFDNSQRGLDKFGHFYSSSLFAQNIYFLSRWSGLNNKNASLTSFILASSIMGAMEVHDAYYERWGFSVGDFIANLSGAAFVVGQYNSSFLKNFDYKFSFDFTKKSDEAAIESYSNMTFWLSANPAGLLKLKATSWFPNWLNIAIGVSITNSYPHRRELLIGLDYNLKRIKTRSVFLRHILNVLDRYRFPAPAIRIAPGFIGYGFYF